MASSSRSEHPYSAKGPNFVWFSSVIRFRRVNQFESYETLYDTVRNHANYSNRHTDDFYLAIVSQLKEKVRSGIQSVPFAQFIQTNEQLQSKNQRIRIYDRDGKTADSRRTSFESDLAIVKQLVKNQTGHDLTTPDVLYMALHETNSKLKETEIITQSTDYFLFDQTSMQNIVDLTFEHGKTCQEKFNVTTERRGHCSQITLYCNKGHVRMCSSSIETKNQGLNGNYQMYKGYLASGMIRDKYDTLCEQAMIGSSKRLMEYDYYHSAIAELSDEHVKFSCQTAIEEEVEMSKEANLTGIRIQSDARHNQRKNSFYSNITVNGKLTRKILAFYTMTKDEEPVTQRHEKAATRKCIEMLQTQLQALDFGILDATHDNNASITNLYRDLGITNNLDNWHGIRKAVSKITNQVSTDKIRDISQVYLYKIRTHFYWSLANCENNPEILKQLLLRVAKHLMNDHSDCSPNSECNMPEYDFQNPISLQSSNWLTNQIKLTDLYKRPELYAANESTSVTESINNSYLSFLDKRVRIGEASYALRTNLAVMIYNENVSNETRRTFKSLDNMHFVVINHIANIGAIGNE